VNYYIPDKTQQLLDAHPVNGTRHTVMKEISFSLIGNQWPTEMVFSLLRERFNSPDIPDKEIRDLVEGAVRKNPAPSGYGTASAPRAAKRAKTAPIAPQAARTATPEQRTGQAEWWLDGYRTSLEDFIAGSPVPIPEKHAAGASMFTRIFEPDDRLNIITKYFLKEDGKAAPQGAGKTLPCSDWVEWFTSQGVPQSSAGAWVRLNPVAALGTGKDGATTDADVAKFRHVLVESDDLPIEVQLSMFTKLGIPVACVTASGDKSAHALVRLKADSAKEFSDLSGALLDALFPFGFDRGNKNPSRLTRLPGAVRSIKTGGDGLQRMLYLNPDCVALDIAGVALLLKRLEVPLISALPMRRLVVDAIQRYEFLFKNQDAPNLMTGFKTFDAETGGLKKGNFIVVSAQTNVGKSSFTLNIVNAVVRRGEGVALFTLEMTEEEITDLLFSMNAGINRNVFNTGKFSELDQNLIRDRSPEIAKLPLWVFDDPYHTCADIRSESVALCAQQDIRLIVVDYAQLVDTTGDRETREQQVAGISRALKALAKECNVPVIAVSQLNEEGKLRESRAIGHDAHTVIALEEGEESHMIARVVKGRNIAKKAYLFFFNPLTCVFADKGILAGEKEAKRVEGDSSYKPKQRKRHD
jgi:KaiC/GvpD/RAD55 family RecA-like ATPase